MTDRDPSTSAGLPEPEIDMPAGSENGDVNAHKTELRHDIEENAARGKTITRLRLIWRQRRFLLRVVVWGLALSTITALVIPKRYESTARLMPPDQGGGAATAMLAALAGKASSLMPMAESTLGVRTTSDLFVGILQSQVVEDGVIRKFELQKIYRARYIEDARKKLAERTDISQDRKSAIITIKITDPDPQRAAAMAQEYVNQLDWVVNNLTTSSAHRERVFLEERLKQVKAELRDAEQQFSKFASEKGTIDIQTQGKAMVEAAATLQGELIAAESQLGGLRQVYTENNVRVRSLQARVAELRRQLEKIGGKGATENSTADELYPSIRQLPLLGVNYSDLLRRVKVQEIVFSTLTQEYELAKVQEAKEIPSVRVLDPPQVPQKKSFPPRLLILILGTMLAMSLGVAWILGNAAWERTSPRDPRKILAVEVLQTLREHLHWDSQNGSRFARTYKWMRAHARKRNRQLSEKQ